MQRDQASQANGTQAARPVQIVQSSAGAAIQCDPRVFSAPERKAHADETLEVLSKLPLRREQVGNGYVFHYEGGNELFLKLAQWAADDHRCCSWVTYAVELQAAEPGKPGVVRLHATTSDEGKAALLAATEATLKQPEQAIRAFLEAPGPLSPAQFAGTNSPTGCC